MKPNPQFLVSGVGATRVPAARSLAMAALLALAATASAQTNGTWTGADGATWDTTATNWSGVTGTPWNSTNGTTANATFNATSGSASVSGTVFANTITYSPVGGNFSIANGTITLAGTTPTINNYDSSGTLTLSSTVAGSAGLISRGAGTLVLAGNNTYTGTTTIRGGPLVLDYSGLSNTADPLSTGAVTLDMGTLVLKGKSSGSTSETISTLNMGANLGTANTLRLDANGGSGIALTTSTFRMNTTDANTQNINLIDLSSSAANSITVGALGSGTVVTNGVLMGNSRANLVVRDSSGYGFATLSGATSGTLGRLSTGTTLNATLSSSTANYRLEMAGTVTRTANLDFSTLTFDSTAGEVTLAMGSNNLAPSGNGRGILITGPNDVSITGSGRLEGTGSTWFHNYSTGTFTYGLSTSLTVSASLMFGGSGLTVWTGNSTKTSGSDNLYIEGGIFRPTAAQNWTTGFGVLTGGVWVSSGAVLEVGADLNGATAGDLTNTVGNNAGAGNIRFWGNSGVSAFGANRTVNFGNATIQLTWGSSSFLTDAGGTGDGNYVFKLSSNRSDSTVTVQNNIALGSLNRTVEVANGSAATDAILSGVISGTGGLVKSGAGALTLNGTNTYTGATTINAGTLSISGGAAIANNGTVTLANTAGVALNVNTSETIGSLQGGGATGGNVTIASGQTLTVAEANTNTFSGSIQGDGSFTKSGAGNLTLSGNNTYTGGTTLTGANNLIMGANNALGNGALTFNTTTTARLWLNGTNQTVTSLSILSASNIAAVIQNEGSSSSSVGTITFNIADGVTSNSTSNFYFRDGSVSSDASLGKLALVKSGNGTLDFSTYNAMSYSGGLTVNGGNFSYNATAALGTGSITLGGGTLNYTGASGSSVSTTNTNMALTAGTTSTLNNANGTVSISAIIAGSGNLTKSGPGTLVLSGANTYNGTTIINDGTLQIGAGSTTGSLSSSSSITNNGTLAINRSDAITISNIISGTGNLTKLGTNALTLNGSSANTYNGTTTVSNGTLTLDKTSGVVAVGGNLVLNGSSKLLYGTAKNEQIANAASITINGSQSVFNGSVWANATTGTIQSNITETIGSLTVRDGQFNTGGGGNWTVTGAGVFDGSSGDVRFLGFSGSSISFGSLSLTAMNGTTIITDPDSFVMGGSSTTATSTLSVGSGGLTLDGSTLGLNKGSPSTSQLGSRLILNGNITTTGSTASFIASNSGTVGISNILLSDVDGSVVTRTITTASGADLTISVPITNGNATTAGIIKDGPGTLTLSGANTYNGATTINAGTLQIGAGSTTGSLSSSSAITNNGTLAINRSDAFTFSNTINGSGSLLKSGGGDLTLAGNNSYQGGTTITGGNNLIMGANNALGNGALTFNSTAAARLNLNGTNQTVTSLSILSNSSVVTVIQNEGSANALGTITFNIADGVTSSSNSNFYFRDKSSLNGTLALVKTGNGTLDLSVLNASNEGYSGGLTLNGGTFSYNSTATTAALGSGAITLGGGTLNYTGSTAQSITNNITLTASTTSILNNANSTITVSRTIAGTGNLIKSGAGTLTLSGASANTYNGTTTVSAGTLTLDKTSGVVAVGGDLVLNGSSKLLYGSASKNEQIANTASITINGSQSVFNGSGWNGTTGANGITETIGSLTVRDGQFNVGGGGNWTVTGAGVFDGSTGDTRFVGNSGSIISFNSLSLTAMSGTTIVSTADSFVVGGQSSTALTTLSVGSGGLTLNGSTLGLNRGVNPGELGSRIILDGNITTTGSSASSIASNSGTIGNSSIQLSSTPGTITRTITTGSGANLTISVPITNGSATTAGIIKDGPGMLTLSGNNTFNGATTVAGGTLLLSGNGTLGTSTISISGGTLDMGGKSLSNTFGSLTGGTLSNGTLTNSGGNFDLQSGTVSAVLAGTNGVNKTTAGTVTLSNANTYNGTTTVNSGTLTAAAAGALGNTSKVFLNNGGSLLVTTDDAIGTNTAVELNGGRLAVNGTFDESVGALTLSANSVIDFSGFVGTLRFSGVGSWASGANLAIWNWSGRTQYQTNYGTYPNSSNLVFTNNATLSSNLANISFYSGSGSGFIGNGFEVSSFSDGFGPGSLIIAVPEPETYITAVALLLGFTFYQLRLARHGQGLLSRFTFLRNIAKRRPL